MSNNAGGASSEMAGQKKLYVKTFGCQMNVYDSARMQDALRPIGYQTVETPEAADVIVVNTCHVREKAAEKVYSLLGQLKDIKRQHLAEGRHTQIAVAGCVAQAEGAEIVKRQPAVDLVVGPQSYHRLPELLFRARQEGRNLVDTSFPEDVKFDRLPQRAPGAGPTAFLTVQEGCDKFCTFCVVPYTRGAEFSRPPSAVLEEARRLVEGGVRDITLLGQNVNAYHGPDGEGTTWSLARLIQELSRLERLERIRYTTSHPRDMRDDLIEQHRSNPKLMPYLHLPFQSGSDGILQAMNRKHTAKDYLVLVERIRDARPDIALSTDVIVGFPGETDADFRATLDLVARVGFAQAFAFRFSPRAGTPAAGMADQVPEPVMAARLNELQELLTSQQSSFNEGCVGKRLQVLFDRQGREPGQIVGRTPYQQSVVAVGDAGLIGNLAAVQVESANRNSLSGVIRAA